jgi:phosphatidate cytidylyltransferase
MAPLSPVADRRNLSLRILSSLALAPLALALVFVGGLPFELILCAATALGLAEWLKLVTGRLDIWTCGAPVLVLAVYLWAGPAPALGAMALAAVVIGAAAARNKVLAAFGLPYVGLTMLALIWLRDPFVGSWPPVFFVFAVVWATDIGAFFVGRTLRGPKLAPRISPNKTWSGFVGGLVFAGAAAIGAMSAIVGASKPAQVVEIAVGLSLLGQGGDLFESAVKRKFGAKDSGTLIPGHGGLLDRIDALLWVAPAFALLHFFGLTAGLSP